MIRAYALLCLVKHRPFSSTPTKRAHAPGSSYFPCPRRDPWPRMLLESRLSTGTVLGRLDRHLVGLSARNYLLLVLFIGCPESDEEINNINRHSKAYRAIHFYDRTLTGVAAGNSAYVNSSLLDRNVAPHLSRTVPSYRIRTSSYLPQ